MQPAAPTAIAEQRGRVEVLDLLRLAVLAVVPFHVPSAAPTTT